MNYTNKWINRMFCIFLFIFCEVANHFCSCTQNLTSQGHCISSQGSKYNQFIATYDSVTGPEQLMYVVLYVQYESKKGGKDQEYTTNYHTWPRLPNGKVTTTQFNTTNKSQEVSPFPAGNHKARKHDKQNTEITQLIHQRNTALGQSVKVFYRRD